MLRIACLLLVITGFLPFWGYAQSAPVLVATGPTTFNQGGNVTLRAQVGKPTFNTVLNPLEYASTVTYNGAPGTQFLFNVPLSASMEPAPATMLVFLNGTQVGQVDFNGADVGTACAVKVNGTTYYTTFQNSDVVELSAFPSLLFSFAKNGAAISGASSDTYTVTTSGDYTVTTTDQAGKTGTSNTITVTVTVALPVQLLRFGLTGQGHSVLVAWATASEVNSTGFGVERSLDGQTWQQVGFVASKGNNSTYTYLDSPTQFNQPLYYRLRQVDQDGTVAYSIVQAIQVVFSATTQQALVIDVFPNPFAGPLTVRGLTAGPAELTVSDAQGRVLLRQRMTTGRRDVQVEGARQLPAGLYLLRVQQAGKSRIVRLIHP